MQKHAAERPDFPQQKAKRLKTQPLRFFACNGSDLQRVLAGQLVPQAVVHALLCQQFMVGGGVARAGDVLFAPLREHFKTYAFSSCRETPIVAATLGNDAGIYGSVRLIVGE